jgi:hypothetical protein
MAIFCGSATLNELYCSHVIFETSIEVCAWELEHRRSIAQIIPVNLTMSVSPERQHHPGRRFELKSLNRFRATDVATVPWEHCKFNRIRMRSWVYGIESICKVIAT